MGAYAATCAYFLMISFVPFLMIFMSFAGAFHADNAKLSEDIMAVIPSGLKAYVEAIIAEVTVKRYVFVPLSVIVLLWSAAKVFHALTNGLNVISRVQETRGWFYLRLRSMIFVVVFFIFVGIAVLSSIPWGNVEAWATGTFPVLKDIIRFFYSFRILIGYFALILVFLFVYKFLPNCYYTFRSQFPGALIVSTVWMFFSYLMSLYYQHNRNFNDTYGNMTGMILAMIWLYFCMYFILFGAELNRVIYEDPEDNVIVNTLGAVKDASVRKQQEIAEELDEHSLWRPLNGDETDLPTHQPKDIDIIWADEDEETLKEALLVREALLRNARMPRGMAAPIDLSEIVKEETAAEAPEGDKETDGGTKSDPRKYAFDDWTAGAKTIGNSGGQLKPADEEKVVNLLGGTNEWN